MKYYIYNYVYTEVDSIFIPTEICCKDSEGNYYKFSILEQLKIEDLNNEFIVSDLHLVSLTNIIFKNGKILKNNMEKTRFLKFKKLIDYVLENGFEYFYKKPYNQRTLKRIKIFNEAIKTIEYTNLEKEVDFFG